MELSAAQRRLAFAVVVFVLAGLGIYLLTSTGHPAASAGAKSGGRPPPQAAPAVSTPAASTSPALPSGSASAGPSVSGLSRPDIYQWLPFTRAGLTTAAAVAVKFGAAYGTYSYTQSAAAYVATMQNLITAQLGEQIAAAYSTPGVTALRKTRKQVSAGAATITSLRAFGPNSLTFVVAVTQQITATTGYAVTVTGGDTNWQVSDVELASAGNF